MTTFQAILHLLRQPDDINILPFKEDKSIPFRLRACIINAYRRHVKPTKGPKQVPKQYAPKYKLPKRCSNCRVRRVHAFTTSRNSIKVIVVKDIFPLTSGGRDRPSRKTKIFRKVVSRVKHLTGTKDTWREQWAT